jgi:hypothetical protein
MADNTNVIAADEFETWLLPSVAIGQLKHLERRSAILTLFERLRYGHIQSAARRFTLQGASGEYLRIDAITWKNAEHGIVTSRLWSAGDITIDIRGRYRGVTASNLVPLALFGVRFEPGGIRELIPQRSPPPALPADPPPATAPQPNKGGRPPKPFWDELWAEICRQLFVGDLKPDTQAKVETAMLDWASAKGHDLSESAAKTRARLLMRALRREG